MHDRSAPALAVLAALAALVVLPSPAAAGFVEVEAEFLPAVPTVDQATAVAVSGLWRDGCTPGATGWELSGDALVLLAATAPPEVACTQAVTPFELRFELGRLAAGTYPVRIEVANEPDCVEPLGALTVVAPGAAPPPAEPAAPPPGQPPAATLLLPYFEVDLLDAAGATTTLAVGNAGAETVVAHLVLWTDLGVPTAAFDLPLFPGDLQTLNLRDVLAGGRVPPPAREVAFPGCTFQVPKEERARLVAAHTGAPLPSGPDAGRCAGSGRTGGSTATGYVTIDVAADCRAAAVFPTEAGYFGPGGRAGEANVLWGDYFRIDPSEASAQGFNLVSLPVRPGLGASTFYRRFATAGEDRRTPLASGYLARFLHGGPFDGGTGLTVWLEGLDSDPRPVACGTLPPRLFCQQLRVVRRDEEGVLLATAELAPPPALAFVQPAVWPEPPAAPEGPQFGFASLAHEQPGACPGAGIPDALAPEPLQAWVTPVMTAAGRFSVGLEATPVAPLP